MQYVQSKIYRENREGWKGSQRKRETKRAGEGIGEGGVEEVERAVWKLQYVSPGALLLSSLATMVSSESDQRPNVIGSAHSCHTVTTTERLRTREIKLMVVR